MDPFEYIIVLVSLILGLGLAQLMNGIADMLAQYKKTKFSTAHTIFIVVVLMVFIQDWWYSYQYSNQIEVWTLPIVLALLSFPMVLFLLARFLFPTGSRSLETDMKLYFFENWRWLYGLFASTIAISIIQNIHISGYTLMEQFPFFAYLAWYIVFIALNIKNMKYHNVFMIIQLIAWFAFLYFEPNTLSNSN